jgi:hypothetical protein
MEQLDEEEGDRKTVDATREHEHPCTATPTKPKPKNYGGHNLLPPPQERGRRPAKFYGTGPNNSATTVEGERRGVGDRRAKPFQQGSRRAFCDPNMIFPKC